MAIVDLGKVSVKIPLKVEKFLSVRYPQMGIRRLTLYSLIFRVGMLLGKRIEL
jgi:hypothetical protein